MPELNRLLAASTPLTLASLARGAQPLVLADAVGIRVGERETSDIADIFALTEKGFIALAYHDPAVGTRDPALPDASVARIARNLESTARFCWSAA